MALGIASTEDLSAATRTPMVDKREVFVWQGIQIKEIQERMGDTNDKICFNLNL